MQQFDIAIIGGGLVGASFARAMAGYGFKIIILDQHPASNLYAVELDNRGLALSYNSCQILSELNVWSQLVDCAHPIKTVHVSEKGSFGFTKLSADDFNCPALGYVINASSIGASLIRDLDKLPGLEVLRPVNIKDLCYNNIEKSWTIVLEDQKINAKLLIAADGTNSFLRTRLKIPFIVKDFKQSAIVANINLQGIQNNVAYERFTSQGVLALLPFGKNKIKCVWTIDNSKLDSIKNLSDDDFLNAVQDMFGYRLGKLVSVEQRKVFPIQHVQASKLYSDSVILLGNAANTLHPVAAQGFNLGLRDVKTLSKMLVVAKNNNLSVNDISILEEYSIQRAKDHKATQKFTNILVELFSSNMPLLKISRHLAILAAQFIPSLNKRIALEGMGICKL